MATAPEALTALALANASVAGRISGVSLAIPAGTLAGLVGPNGSGKSTLLQVAAGLLPAGGAVRWGAEPLASLPIEARARRAAWVPQEVRFEFGFSVRSVVAQGRYAHGDDDRGVAEALADCDLTELAERPVDRLSGGERQRVLLARALAMAAPLQLWDEPLAALDIRHALQVLALARRLSRAGTTVLFSTHDLRIAESLDLVAVMAQGTLAGFGPPGEVLTPAFIERVFGVRSVRTSALTLELP